MLDLKNKQHKMASQLSEKNKAQFLEKYSALNEQQRQAVDTIEGPVMVIAGPGTGKTQILSARIAHILMQADVGPENILCLTFTDAGVLAMRKRLYSFMGSEAYKINLHTFHSFCNKVIQENMEYFNKGELDAISDLEKIDTIKEIIDELKKDNPLKRYKGDVYYDLKNLEKLFSAIKREGWEMEWLKQEIIRYRDETIMEEFHHKVKVKKGIYELTNDGKKEQTKQNNLLAAIDCFDAYQKKLAQKKLYDFDDMITWVVKLFQEENDILLNYQEQYQYILVDEYQDTSGAQNKIVELLISYWQDESPNVFVVGDDDQSIYRFQGANLKNMMNIAHTYEADIKHIVLTQNYRSVQPILDGAKGLIERNNQRLIHQFPHLNKDFFAANKQLKDLNIAPQINAFQNSFCESVYVAKKIQELIEGGAHPGKIAVLYRKHDQGTTLIHFFEKINIPYYVKKSINLVQDVFVGKILTLMRYFAAEADIPFSGEQYLFEILHYQFYTIPAFSIAKIVNDINASRAKTEEDKTLRGFLMVLKEKNKNLLFANNEEEAELLRVANMLEKMHQELHNRSFQHWFELLLNEAGVLQSAMLQPNKHDCLAKINCLFNVIKDATQRNPDLHLLQFLQTIDLMVDNDIGIPYIQSIGSEEGVSLLTAHGSKGLEFEHVFVIGVESNEWESKRNTNKGFVIPHTILDQDSDADVLEELRRLFFVAVTRAEKYLYLSFAKHADTGKPQESALFLNEFKDALTLDINNISISEDDKTEFAALRAGLIVRPILKNDVEAATEKDFVNKQLAKFVMNVSSLNSYLTCPLQFYYGSLIKVPMAKSEAASFGTTVHDALETYIATMMQQDKNYPSKEFLLQSFKKSLYKNRAVFTTLQLERYKEHGDIILSKYYDKNFANKSAGDFYTTETQLTNIVIEGVPVKGFIDKIQYWGNDIVITDYKTGDYKKGKDRGDFNLPSSPKKPDGGNYWRQAVFYQLLVKNNPLKNWNLSHIEFDYVESYNSEKPDKVVMSITAEDETIVKEQIKNVWERIQAHDFYTGCGKKDCNWCNFVKTNNINSSAIEELIEPETQDNDTKAE